MCPNCGNKLEEGARFCPKCGTAASAPAEALTQVSVDATETVPGAKGPDKKPGKRSGKKAVIGLIAAAIIAGGGYYAGYSYY